MSDGRLEVTFRVSGRVREREDDGLLVIVGHLLEDLGGEDASKGGETHQHGGLDMVYNFFQGLELLAVVIMTRKVDFVGCESVASVRSDKTLSVNQVEASFGLILGHSLLDEEIDDLLSNTNTCTSGAEEHSTVVLWRNARSLDGIYHTAQDDGSSSLDIIVETSVVVPVFFEGWEGILEVFKLYNNTIALLAR